MTRSGTSNTLYNLGVTAQWKVLFTNAQLYRSLLSRRCSTIRAMMSKCHGDVLDTVITIR